MVVSFAKFGIYPLSDEKKEIGVHPVLGLLMALRNALGMIPCWRCQNLDGHKAVDQDMTIATC
jgi:hypothetical protein